MIGWIKNSVLAAPASADTPTKRGYDFVAGVVGGTLATLANTPFDVVSFAFPTFYPFYCCTTICS